MTAIAREFRNPTEAKPPNTRMEEWRRGEPGTNPKNETQEKGVMSFCRFSSEDFKCDFYAYESVDGYHLHVAGNRHDRELPQSPYSRESPDLPKEEYNRASREYHEALMSAPRISIDLEGAGEHHVFGTLRELRESIAEHVQRGFRAPEWLLPSLDEQMESEEPDATPESTT